MARVTSCLLATPSSITYINHQGQLAFNSSVLTALLWARGVMLAREKAMAACIFPPAAI